MVQLEKVQGQKGHMVIHEDGTIISSSGELASSENTAHQIVNMMSHSIHANFQDTVSNGAIPSSGNVANGGASGDNNGQVWRWNRITVDFGEHSIIACLSNRKIHIVKRDNSNHLSSDVDPIN